MDEVFPLREGVDYKKLKLTSEGGLKTDLLGFYFSPTNTIKMNTCPAVRATGEVCGNHCREGNPRCGTHMNALTTYGPHTVAQKELRYRYRAIFNRTRDEGVAQSNVETAFIRERMRVELYNHLRLLKLEERHALDLLIREQQNEIHQTGIDPDQQAQRRREEQRRLRNEVNQLHWQQRLVGDRDNEQNLVVARANIIGQAVAMVVPRGELENFARDNQNVHTTTAVRQTSDMVQKILAIPVTSDYRWNVNECSKTPGDIIMCCKLTSRGAWQMVAKYCQDEDIYEMGKGIYGKVLDGVWQYILKSSDKEDLCKILKQEMEDNIGMCAQGNLTRLCNILTGYMDGIGVQESPSEILGRKLPLLMEIENIEERLSQAYMLMIDLSVPMEQWLSWVEYLVENGSVGFRENAGGEVIGLIVN